MHSSTTRTHSHDQVRTTSRNHRMRTIRIMDSLHNAGCYFLMNYFAQSYPPPYAEYLLHKGIMASQRKLGRITQDGKPQTLVQEWEEIDPSVGRVMTYLYDNDTVHITNAGAKLCGLPNVTQLRTDLKWLIDQGIAAATIHDGKQVAFLTPRGEDIIDGNS